MREGGRPLRPRAPSDLLPALGVWGKSRVCAGNRERIDLRQGEELGEEPGLGPRKAPPTANGGTLPRQSSWGSWVGWEAAWPALGSALWQKGRCSRGSRPGTAQPSLLLRPRPADRQHHHLKGCGERGIFCPTSDLLNGHLPSKKVARGIVCTAKSGDPWSGCPPHRLFSASPAGPRSGTASASFLPALLGWWHFPQPLGELRKGQ